MFENSKTRARMGMPTPPGMDLSKLGQKKTPAEYYVELAQQVDLLFKQIAAICLLAKIKPEDMIKQFYKDDDVAKYLAECIGVEKYLSDQETKTNDDRKPDGVAQTPYPKT